MQNLPTFKRLNWLDNDRVLFAGNSFDTWDKDRRTVALFIWDTRLNKVVKYADLDQWGSYCYSRDYFWYGTPESGHNDRLVIRQGVLGRETEVVFPRNYFFTEERNKRGVFEAALTCRDAPYTDKAKSAKYGLSPIYAPLLSGHGFLDVTGHPENVRWFPPNAGEPVTLPIPKVAVNRFGINYSEWNSAYLLYGYQAPPDYKNPTGAWPKGVAQPVWLLHMPTGKVEQQELPYEKWLRGANTVLSTRAGLVTPRGDASPDEGLYLAKGNGYVKIIYGGGGEVNAAGVSPDGCKVAGAVSTQFNNRRGGLKMVNVCGTAGRR